MPEAEIRFLGPLYDGRAHLIMDTAIYATNDAMGHMVLEKVNRNLAASIRHPTPYYQTMIELTKAGDHDVVWDQGVIYGPWLEGTSRRNQTTRFKGYSSFRRAYQEANREAPGLARSILNRFLRMF